MSFNLKQNYYKLCDSEGKTRRKFQYQKGIVEDQKPLSESPDCNGSGLYFTDIEHIFYWSRQLNYEYYFMVKPVKGETVIICNSGNKFKTNKLDVITDLKHLSELEELQDYNFCMKIIKENSYNLKYIKNQTYELCFEAITKEPNSLFYVHEHIKRDYPELCFLAVSKNGTCLYYLSKEFQTDFPEICDIACNASPYARNFIKIEII